MVRYRINKVDNNTMNLKIINDKGENKKSFT